MIVETKKQELLSQGLECVITYIVTQHPDDLNCFITIKVFILVDFYSYYRHDYTDPNNIQKEHRINNDDEIFALVSFDVAELSKHRLNLESHLDHDEVNRKKENDMK